MKEKFADQILTIALDNRIDSNSVNGVEEQIEAWIGEKNPENIILDAKDLAYISSAGLRLLLKLQKKFPEMKVINVSRDVQDIFEMTGFDQILNIEKALRKLSIDGLELIGEGGNGKVYRIDDETIVKVYKTTSLDKIKEELDYAKKAFVKGVPTAISFDIVDVDGAYGVVYEMIRSDTLAHALNKEPERLEEWAKKYADLMKTIASTDISDFVDVQKNDLVIEKFKDLKGRIPQEEIDQLMEIIELYPRTNTMIHSDMHSRNVMVQDGELMLIDMDDIARGHPIIDLSHAYHCYNALMNFPNGLDYIGISAEISLKLSKALLDAYFCDLSEEDKEKVIKAVSIGAVLELCSSMIEMMEGQEDEQSNAIRNSFIERLRKEALPFKEEIREGLALYPQFN